MIEITLSEQELYNIMMSMREYRAKLKLLKGQNTPPEFNKLYEKIVQALDDAYNQSKEQNNDTNINQQPE